MARRVFDISQVLRPGLPVWPGDTPWSSARTWTIGPECPVTVSALTCSTHSGTHADAPLHYCADGQDCAALDLEAYLGPCTLIDARGAGPMLTLQHLARHRPTRTARILFRTYEAFPHQMWRSDWTSIHPDVIDALAADGVRLIGVDSPSLDPQDSKTMDAHHAVARQGMRVLEGLVLDAPPAGDYELIALPLALQGLDASPVRAILRDLPSADNHS